MGTTTMGVKLTTQPASALNPPRAVLTARRTG